MQYLGWKINWNCKVNLCIICRSTFVDSLNIQESSSRALYWKQQTKTSKTKQNHVCQELHELRVQTVSKNTYEIGHV